MHFRRKLFLKRLAPTPNCGEIALTFKLALPPSKMGTFTTRDSGNTYEKCFLITDWPINEIIMSLYVSLKEYPRKTKRYIIYRFNPVRIIQAEIPIKAPRSSRVL